MQKSQLVSQFVECIDCSREEAIFWLKRAEWDFESALELRERSPSLYKPRDNTIHGLNEVTEKDDSLNAGGNSSYIHVLENDMKKLHSDLKGSAVNDSSGKTTERIHLYRNAFVFRENVFDLSLEENRRELNRIKRGEISQKLLGTQSDSDVYVEAIFHDENYDVKAHLEKQESRLKKEKERERERERREKEKREREERCKRNKEDEKKTIVEVPSEIVLDEESDCRLKVRFPNGESSIVKGRKDTKVKSLVERLRSYYKGPFVLCSTKRLDDEKTFEEEEVVGSVIFIRGTG